jgi:hypothetical protein
LPVIVMEPNGATGYAIRTAHGHKVRDRISYRCGHDRFAVKVAMKRRSDPSDFPSCAVCSFGQCRGDRELLMSDCNVGEGGY